MSLDKSILTIAKTQEELSIEVMQNFLIKKNELIEKIISQLTLDPSSDGNELVKAFFVIAETGPSDRTISAFQNMYYILKDAKELKHLLQKE
jgi:hypothetical protein